MSSAFCALLLRPSSFDHIVQHFLYQLFIARVVTVAFMMFLAFGDALSSIKCLQFSS